MSVKKMILAGAIVVAATDIPLKTSIKVCGIGIGTLIITNEAIER
ncbi:hypothetical protein [Bacillus sp. SM2101]|nr:hypothetical protein [Bacillus sp. SM2101]